MRDCAAVCRGNLTGEKSADKRLSCCWVQEGRTLSCAGRGEGGIWGSLCLTWLREAAHLPSQPCGVGPVLAEGWLCLSTCVCPPVSEPAGAVGVPGKQGSQPLTAPLSSQAPPASSCPSPSSSTPAWVARRTRRSGQPSSTTSPSSSSSSSAGQPHRSPTCPSSPSW